MCTRPEKSAQDLPTLSHSSNSLSSSLTFEDTKRGAQPLKKLLKLTKTHTRFLQVNFSNFLSTIFRFNLHIPYYPAYQRFIKFLKT